MIFKQIVVFFAYLRDSLILSRRAGPHIFPYVFPFASQTEEYSHSSSPRLFRSSSVHCFRGRKMSSSCLTWSSSSGCCRFRHPPRTSLCSPSRMRRTHWCLTLILTYSGFPPYSPSSVHGTGTSDANVMRSVLYYSTRSVPERSLLSRA